MKWRGRKKSSNVEDRRGKSISGKGIAGLGGVGIIIMVAIALITGNPTMILEQLLGIQGEQQSTTAPYTETEEDQELADFVSVVLNDTEAVWSERFEENGMTYKEPTLVLYTDAVQTACGTKGETCIKFMPSEFYLHMSKRWQHVPTNTFT